MSVDPRRSVEQLDGTRHSEVTATHVCRSSAAVCRGYMFVVCASGRWPAAGWVDMQVTGLGWLACSAPCAPLRSASRHLHPANNQDQRPAHRSRLRSRASWRRQSAARPAGQHQHPSWLLHRCPCRRQTAAAAGHTGLRGEQTGLGPGAVHTIAHLCGAAALGTVRGWTETQPCKACQQ